MSDHLRLHQLGYHLVPIAGDKKPAIRWRKGERDYVESQPSLAEIRRWESLAHGGWGLLCGGPKRLVCLDVEADGMDAYADVLAGLDPRCIRPTPSGGAHAWLRVPDGPRPGNHKLAVDEDGVLLAEVRGHGGYALITGPKRPPLAEDWEPQEMAFADFRSLFPTKEEPEPEATSRGKVRRLGIGSTADALFEMVRETPESIIELLDPGWRTAGHDRSGRLGLLRPDYGSPTDNETSANVKDGVLVVWSTSVPWAEPGKPMTPTDALAKSRFGGNIHAALNHVEQSC